MPGCAEGAASTRAGCAPGSALPARERAARAQRPSRALLPRGCAAIPARVGSAACASSAFFFFVALRLRSSMRFLPSPRSRFGLLALLLLVVFRREALLLGDPLLFGRRCSSALRSSSLRCCISSGVGLGGPRIGFRRRFRLRRRLRFWRRGGAGLRLVVCALESTTDRLDRRPVRDLRLLVMRKVHQP